MRRPIVLRVATSGEDVDVDLEEKCRCCDPELGDNSQCPECDGTGIAMSYHGEKLIEFVRRWVMRGYE